MNRLKELRNEYNLTIRALEKLTGIGSTAISLYESESRDFNTNVLKIFSDFFCVTINYLLHHRDDGVFVYYEHDDKVYQLDDAVFKQYKNDGFIYYKNYKRYLDINKILEIKKETNVSELLKYISDYDLLQKESNQNDAMIGIPMDRIGIIEKIIKLDDSKFNAVKSMIELL